MVGSGVHEAGVDDGRIGRLFLEGLLVGVVSGRSLEEEAFLRQEVPVDFLRLGRGAGDRGHCDGGLSRVRDRVVADGPSVGHKLVATEHVVDAPKDDQKEQLHDEHYYRQHDFDLSWEQQGGVIDVRARPPVLKLP